MDEARGPLGRSWQYSVQIANASVSHRQPVSPRVQMRLRARTGCRFVGTEHVGLLGYSDHRTVLMITGIKEVLSVS